MLRIVTESTIGGDVIVGGATIPGVVFDSVIGYWLDSRDRWGVNLALHIAHGLPAWRSLSLAERRIMARFLSQFA